MACNNIVRLGTGEFYGFGGSPALTWGGHKYVCEDDFGGGEDPCVVYSFGVGTDASFEEVMAARGM